MGIRRFRASDAEKASKLIRRCLLEVNSKDYPMESIEKMCKQHSPENLIVISMKQDMYVFVRNNDVLGTGCLVQNWIQTVFVNPDYQGRGIGKKLIVHLEKVMGDRGYVTSIVPSSITAYEFYRKLGYRKTKVINDEDSGRNIIMEKKLRKKFECVSLFYARTRYPKQYVNLTAEISTANMLPSLVVIA